jgi:hypothetical protein
VKLLDYFIIAALLACLSVTWIGFHLEGALAGVLVLIAAGWRFYDKRQGQKLDEGNCCDNVPDLPDTSDADEP